MKRTESQKVFILGLDGATFRIMMPMIEKGKLPAFASIIKEGVHCELNSTILSNSAPAWTSFATGKNPGKHSISGFFRLMPNSYQLKLLSGKDNKAKTLWEVVGEYGKKSVVMNIPMTFPPKAINGLLVSGLDTPSLSSDFTHPPELRAELLRLVPDYRINLHLGGYLHNDKRRKKAIDIMLSSTRARERAVLHLMKNYSWDLFAVRFNSPDNVQHQFWRFMDEDHPHYDPNSPEVLKSAIYTLYEELDRVMASIVHNLPEECTLIIMSDHGAGPRTNKTIRLNEWLRSLGYLASKPEVKRSKKRMYGYMEKALSAFLRRVPSELKQWLMKRAPDAISRTWTYFRFPNIDWANTKAFVGETEGVRINLRGEYPNGIVEIDEYDELRGYLIDKLRELRDPTTGECVFMGVYKREDIFEGPYVIEFPDIIAITTKDQYNISPKMAASDDSQAAPDSIFSTEDHWRKVSGSHRKEGILIIRGKEVKEDLSISATDITDVFPTALYFLGLPVPSDVDGRVISEVVREEYLKKHPVVYKDIQSGGEIPGTEGREYTDEEREKLADHLRGLGYIE